MAEVKIPPVRARQVAAACKAAADELTDIQADLDTSMGGLIDDWRGEAEIKYVEAFEDRVVRLNDRQMLLRRIGGALLDIARIADDADRKGKAVAPGG